MSKQRTKSRKQPRTDSQQKPPGETDAPCESPTLNPFASGISFRTFLIIIVVFALVLRIANVLLTLPVPTAATLVGDAEGYFQWAAKIAAGDWYGKTTFYQAPLYPYFLAVQLKAGLGVTGLRLVQAVLGACGVGLLGYAARDRFDERTGVLAAALFAVYAPAIYYDGIIQKAALASFLLCGLLAAIGFKSKLNWGSLSFLIGVLLGLLVITRENALLWIPVVGLWVIVAPRSLPIKRKLIQGSCYVAGLAVVLMPVAMRNASLGGEWSPTTFQAGPNFYIGNGLQSFGIYQPLVPGHETPLYERADAERIAEETTGKAMSAREVSAFWMDQAIQDIRTAPGRWCLLMVQKCFMVINRFEVPDVESLDVYREYSPPLRLVSIWNFGVLFPFAVIGIVGSWHRWKELWLDYAMTLTMIGAVVLFFILGRYRLPLVPLLMPFAAHGIIVTFCTFKKMTPWSESKLAIIAGLVAAVLCNLPVHDESGLAASSMMNSAIAAGRKGDTSTAIRMLQESIEMEPRIADTHYNLGRALLQAGRPRQAIRSIQNALRLDPELSMADYLLGTIHERLGETDAARHHYQRASAIGADPQRAMQALERLESRE